MALTKPSGSMIKNETITSSNITDGTITMPKLTLSQSNGSLSIAYPLGNAASNGDIITISGGTFALGSTTLIGDDLVGATFIVDSNTVSFAAPDKPTGVYVGMIVQSDGHVTSFPITYN